MRTWLITRQYGQELGENFGVWDLVEDDETQVVAIEAIDTRQKVQHCVFGKGELSDQSLVNANDWTEWEIENGYSNLVAKIEEIFGQPDEVVNE